MVCHLQINSESDFKRGKGWFKHTISDFERGILNVKIHSFPRQKQGGCLITTCSQRLHRLLLPLSHSCRDKMAAFCRPQFQIHFLKWKGLCFDSNILLTHICVTRPRWVKWSDWQWWDISWLQNIKSYFTGAFSCIFVKLSCIFPGAPLNMMTPSHGNIFRVTGLLCGEFAGHRWIPLTKASDSELWCFLWSVPE